MGGLEASLSKKNQKKTQVHPLHVGGGSKIKSAVTICLLDRSEHITLELVSITDWDLLLGWTDPACQGCSGLSFGILLAEFLFYCFYNSPSSFSGR